MKYQSFSRWLVLFCSAAVCTLAVRHSLLAADLTDYQALQQDARVNDDVGTSAQWSPRLALSSYNFAVVCWWDNRTGSARIYAQRFGQRGLKFQNNFQVDPANPAADQFNPDVAINDLGHFVVVWEEVRDSVNVYARLYAANKEPLAPIIRVNERANPASTTASPAVAMNERGDFVITWVGRHSDPVGDIYAQRFDSSGEKVGRNFLVHNDTNHAQNYPDVAINESGRFVIVWEDGRDLHRPSHLYEIYAHVYDSTGVADGADFAVSAHPAGTTLPATPSVAMQTNGNFFVVWSYGDDQIYGHLFRADKQTIKSDFVMSTLVGGLVGPNHHPRITRSPGGLYGLVWDSERVGNYGICFKIYDANGNQVGGHLILNESVGQQERPDIAISKKGLLLCAWEDDREGNPDIYGTWRGVNIPGNVIAGSGFNGRVPLSWDHLYGNDKVNGYRVWRSISMTSPLVLIATVDLSARGLLGSSMRDYIDLTAVNGQTYYYRIEADAPESQGPSLWATATPAAGGHKLQSRWSTHLPSIDGILSGSEWDDATRLDISTAHTPQPVLLYIKNDSSHLYIAVDDPNDPNVDPANTFGFVFDLDHNGQWDARGPSKEGIIQITPTNALFLGAWGTYPNHLGADVPRNAAGVTRSFSAVSGHVQYEIRFDFGSSPVKAKAGDTLGVALYVNDPGNHYFDHYGNAGEWPYGYLWEAAESLGDLILATSAPPDTITPPPNVLLVTHTGNSGAGSLREALLQASSTPGRDNILFQLPLSDPNYDATAGVWVIRPTSPLPAIGDSTVIDGLSQAKYLGLTDAPTKPLIVISGRSGLYRGLSINGSYNHVNALTISNFEIQIIISGHHNQVSSCFIGTDATGSLRGRDSYNGIVVVGGDENIIGGSQPEQGNVIAGCLQFFGLVFDSGACGNQVCYNYIGINSAGADTLGNGGGIDIGQQSNRNRIGPGNVISGNYGYGISISQSDSTEIKGNLIGLDPSGIQAWGNEMAGIAVSHTSRHTVIGGSTSAERNVISGNGDGIILFIGENDHNQITGNFIGTDISGTKALGNANEGIGISDGNHNIIGGSGSSGNVISGNGRAGICLAGFNTTNNMIVNNSIGTNWEGTLPLGNGSNGIYVSLGPCRNTIGPTNRIFFNERFGVCLSGTATTANTITQNRISQNKLGGIE
ncbi:MAG: right-handed parallel beta-helix repeat-containing protein, partial [Calditrichaeota bacterium]|nr:right-handed parallel beta-helix repeat-containing protein [Calditrichota bacterium]